MLDLGGKVVIGDLQLTAEAQALIDNNKQAAFKQTNVTKWSELHQLVVFAKESFGSTPDVYVAVRSQYCQWVCSCFGTRQLINGQPGCGSIRASK